MNVGEFISQKDEIERLNKQVKLLQQNNSKWKMKYEALVDKPSKRKSRTNKAEVFVRLWIGGDKSLSFREIAKKCFLSIETIKNISYKLRHQND